MKTIYKYPVSPQNLTEVELPKGAQILSIQNQNEEACLWALVDTGFIETETRRIAVFGTGHKVSVPGGELKFISTVQFHDGSLVFHFFENVDGEW